MLTMMLSGDNDIIRERLRYIIELEFAGITITAAVSNGLAALEAINREVPDIIISDVSMPGLNGLEMLEFLKKQQFASKVILVSSHDRFEYAQQALRLGAFDYILKPIDEVHLLETIENCSRLILRERREEEAMESLRKCHKAQFAQILQRMYCEEGYELPEEDWPVWQENSKFFNNSKTVISAGFWGKELPDGLFAALTYPAAEFQIVPESCNWTAIVLLTEDPSPDNLYNEVIQLLADKPDFSVSRAYPWARTFSRI